MSVVVRQLINSHHELELPTPIGPTSVFLLPALLDMWQKSLGWNGICVTSGNTSLIGLEKATAAGKIFFSMPYGGYGGILGEGTADDVSALTTWLCGRRYLQENIVQFQITPSIEYPDNYYRNRLATHIIDLATTSSEYSENTRRNIKKAQDQNLQVVQLTSSDSAAYLALLQLHQKRTGEVRRFPQTCYEYLLAKSDNRDSGIKAIAAKNGSALHCVHIYFATTTDAFYFDGFSSQDGLDAGANFLLLDSMINQFRDAGLQRLNLGATPPLDKGLRRFKEAWGAIEHPYTEYVRRTQLKRFIDFMTRIR
ncbi:MAG: GNAT family N-acetyltransferase [bacterium]|nr:GNAT family N-acetyltransferase [bacterium]